MGYVQGSRHDAVSQRQQRARNGDERRAPETGPTEEQPEGEQYGEPAARDPVLVGAVGREKAGPLPTVRKDDRLHRKGRDQEILGDDKQPLLCKDERREQQDAADRVEIDDAPGGIAFKADQAHALSSRDASAAVRARQTRRSPVRPASSSRNVCG